MLYKAQIIKVINDFLGNYGPLCGFHNFVVTEGNLDTRIKDIPDFDSLDEVELVMCLEDEFKIELLDEEVEQLPSESRTLGSYAKLVNDKLELKAPKPTMPFTRTGPSLKELVDKFSDFEGPEASGKVVPPKKPQIRVSAVLNSEEQRQMWLKLGGANWLRKFLAATAKGRSQ